MSSSVALVLLAGVCRISATSVPLLSPNIVPLLYSIDFIFLYDELSLAEVGQLGSDAVDLFEKELEHVQYSSQNASFLVSEFERGDTDSSLEYLRFFGTVVIKIQLKEAISYVQLMMGQCVNLLGTTMLPDETTLNCTRHAGDLELVKCDFGRLLQPGEIEIRLTYSSHFVHEDSNCSSLDKYLKWSLDSNYHVLLHSSTEPTGARSLFPSFDEPPFKCQYRITVTAPAHMKAFSNEEVESVGVVADEPDIPPGSAHIGVVKTQFKTSSVMATYMVTIILGQLTSSSETKANGIAWRVVRPTADIGNNLEQFELDSERFVRRAIRFYESARIWLDIDPKLSRKMDLIDIGDCSSPMEHPGAIHFRSDVFGLEDAIENCTLCLVDRDVGMPLQNVLNVVAHEIAHQWFGNLVTMRWWNDLWLSEGLASYMEVDLQRHSALHLRKQSHYYARVESRYFSIYLLETDKEVIGYQNTSVDLSVDHLFTEAVYTRSSAVLQMLEGVIGREAFYDGLKLYLKRHKYSIATARNFFDSMQQSINEYGVYGPDNQFLDAGNFLWEWTFNKLIPLVRVERSEENKIMFQQFALFNRSESLAPWNIPISLRVQTGKIADLVTYWLTTKRRAINIDYNYNNSLIFLHDNPFMLYRVQYDHRSLDVIYETFIDNCNHVSIESMTAFYMNEHLKDGQDDPRLSDLRKACLADLITW